MKKGAIQILVLILGLVVADQVTKVLAVDQLRGRPAIKYLGNTAILTYRENKGAFLSLGANWSERTRFLVFDVVSGLALLAVAFILIFRTHSRWMTIAFAVILAGGIGNMIDRLRFGYVIDFMNVGIGNLRTGVFNIADMAIMAGIFIVFGLSFKKEEKKD